MRPLGDEPGFTVEGNLRRVGAFAVGLRHARGWRRVVGYALVAMVAVPIAIGVVVGLVELVTPG